VYKVVIFLYLSFSLVVFAESTPIVSDNIRVQSLVKQVKSAQPSDKRVLMNRLKVMLRHTNQVHRMKVMKDLKQSFSHTKTMYNGQQKRKNNFKKPNYGKHQPKYRGYRHRKGQGQKGGGRHGGGNRH